MRLERIGPESKLWQKWEPRLENWAIVFAPREKLAPPPRKVYEDLEHWRVYAKDFETRKPDARAATWEDDSPIGLYSEAVYVRDLVLRLDLELEKALVAWYWWTGSISSKAEDLGIHQDTLRNRVGYAIQYLEDLEGAKRRGAALPVGRKRQVELAE